MPRLAPTPPLTFAFSLLPWDSRGCSTPRPPAGRQDRRARWAGQTGSVPPQLFSSYLPGCHTWWPRDTMVLSVRHGTLLVVGHHSIVHGYSLMDSTSLLSSRLPLTFLQQYSTIASSRACSSRCVTPHYSVRANERDTTHGIGHSVRGGLHSALTRRVTCDITSCVAAIMALEHAAQTHSWRLQRLSALRLSRALNISPDTCVLFSPDNRSTFRLASRNKRSNHLLPDLPRTLHHI